TSVIASSTWPESQTAFSECAIASARSNVVTKAWVGFGPGVGAFGSLAPIGRVASREIARSSDLELETRSRSSADATGHSATNANSAPVVRSGSPELRVVAALAPIAFETAELSDGPVS